MHDEFHRWLAHQSGDSSWGGDHDHDSSWGGDHDTTVGGDHDSSWGGDHDGHHDSSWGGDHDTSVAGDHDTTHGGDHDHSWDGHWGDPHDEDHINWHDGSHDDWWDHDEVSPTSDGGDYTPTSDGGDHDEVSPTSDGGDHDTTVGGDHDTTDGGDHEPPRPLPRPHEDHININVINVNQWNIQLCFVPYAGGVCNFAEQTNNSINLVSQGGQYYLGESSGNDAYHDGYTWEQIQEMLQLAA